MEEKLNELYNECIEELKSIGINVIDNELIGEIDICFSKRNTKRYGCCKQEQPVKTDYHIKRYKNDFRVVYNKFKKHHIEISKWVMELNYDIIKNTIIHEIIHCFPNCNNHGKMFQEYASFINKKLGYNIKTLGNKEEDFKESNLEYKENLSTYKYKIICKGCGAIIYRQRLKKNLIKKYRCGKCNGRLEVAS